MRPVRTAEIAQASHLAFSGFDRLMAILCRTESIRDVIAFPKTGAGTDLLFRSPAAADAERVLQQYGIQPRSSS